MQIMERNIFKFKDITYDEMNKALKVIEEKARAASAHPTQKVWFVVWYNGHGEILDGSSKTLVVLNDFDETKRRFPLEQKLSEIASINNT